MSLHFRVYEWIGYMDSQTSAWTAWAEIADSVHEVLGTYWPGEYLAAALARPDEYPVDWYRAAEAQCVKYDRVGFESGAPACQRPVVDGAGWTWYGRGRTTVGVRGRTVRLVWRETSDTAYQDRLGHPRVVAALSAGLQESCGRDPLYLSSAPGVLRQAAKDIES